MKTNDVLHINAYNTADVFKNSSLNKSTKSFISDKIIAKKKNAAKDEQNLPAPYYDELHFADYE